MEYLVEQQLIRTVVALCAIAAQSSSPDVRDDMRDQAAALVHLGAGAQTEPIRRYCAMVAPRLQALVTDETQPHAIVLSAHAQVLRLVATLPAGEPKPRPVLVRLPSSPKPPRPAKDLAGNEKKVLAYVADHPDIRTKEIVDHFSHTLSDRTVKRCLKELVSSGALSRTDIKGTGVVTYRVAVS